MNKHFILSIIDYIMYIFFKYDNYVFNRWSESIINE